jgi:hypothetical protein
MKPKEVGPSFIALNEIAFPICFLQRTFINFPEADFGKTLS